MHEKGAYDVDEDEGDNELERDDVERQVQRKGAFDVRQRVKGAFDA